MMTQILQVNSNNDISLDAAGRLQRVFDLEAVLQQCEHALSAQITEMIYAADRGVNALTNLFSGSPNVLSYEASARDQLNRIPDVIAVEEFESELRGHTLNYRATIRTVFGIGLVSGVSGG